MSRLNFFVVKQLLYILLCLAVGRSMAQQLNTYPEAQKQAPPLQAVMPVNSLPEQTVTDVAQDAAGFIWIATQTNGLVRYDGENTKRFTHREGDRTSLASNSIWYMRKDRLNRLWLIYHSGEFDLFDPVREQVRHLSAELRFFEKAAPFLMDKQKEINFLCGGLFEDSQQRMWMLFLGVVVRVDATSSGDLLFYPRFSQAEDRPVTANETPEGRLLFITDNYVAETDGTLRLQHKTPLPQKILTHNFEMWHSCFLKKDTLYINARQGVHVYNPQTREVFFRPSGLTSLQPSFTASPANDRMLFYDTSSAHIYQYVGGAAGFSDLGKYDYYGTQNFRVTIDKLVYLFDRDGGLWHASFLLFYSAEKKTYYTLIKGVDQFFKQISKYVLHLPEDIANKYTGTIYESYPWVRSPAGALYVVDSTRRLQLMVPAPISIDPDPKGRKWMVLFKGNARLLADGSFDPAYRLWVIDGLKRELFTIDTMGRVQTCSQRLPSGYNIVSITAAKNGGCWVNQFNVGLHLYSLDKGLVKTLDKKTSKSPMPETSFHSMVRDSVDKNIIWITTIGSGVVRFNEREETWQQYTEENGWTSNAIYTPVVDDKGFIWYQSAGGIYRYDSRRNSHRLLVRDSSYKATNWLLAFYVITNRNQLWFGNNYDYVGINTDLVPTVKNTSAAFTGLRINNQPVTNDSSILPAPINTLPELSLAYDQNFVAFQFAAFNYGAAQLTRYRYQLEGIDKTWVDAGTGNEAQYTSLPPGHYTFKVNATNEDGTWSSEVKSIRVVISPPWWRTWWMYTLYALALIGAVWLFMKNRLRRLQLNQQVVLKQKEAEQAQAMEETKSRFFANITHELRTPLTLIMSPVQRQLQEGPTTYSPQLLTGVYRNSQLLLRLINQLLDMGKLEGGRMPVTLSRGHLAPFIDSLLNGFRQQAAARNIRLGYEHNDFKEEHLFDNDKLEKIIYNLLSNAFKFTPDGGTISLQLQKAEAPDSTDVAIRVTDSGIGISPEHLPHVFDRFYQVNTSTTRKYEGTGIGLSLVKELVELMGGEIKADSVEGQGSTFSVSLPLAVAGQQVDAPLVSYPVATELATLEDTAPTESTAAPDVAKPVVLVTDDNEQLRQFIADSLSPHYQVLTAANGQEGLQVATAELPELIISDVMMPVMDGYEFCQKVKEASLTSHIGVVLLTAKTADESRLSGLRLGADHYLSKPFNVEELLLVVSNLLKRQQKLREHYGRQLQQPAEKLPPVKEVEDKFLQSVYAVIEANLDGDKLDIDFLASEMAVSRRTLNRKLSTIAGTSANEVIRNYRLKKAAELLLKGETVSSAAYATGFSTPSWFSQCFKELYGISPVQYTETGGVLAQN